MYRMKTIALVVLLILAAIALVVLVEGCNVFRKTAISISESEVKNLATAQEVALNYLKIWPMQSGFIHGALGPRMDELPAHVVEAIEELDRLSGDLNISDPNNIGDYDLGLSLGLRVRLLATVVFEGLKMYAPDVIEVLPLVF